MELKDFIEQSISDIIEATNNIKEKYNKNNHCIAPEFAANLNHAAHNIDFDIAVTTAETGTAKSGSKIGISVLGANINGEKGFANENCSRLKFSIPFYPEFIKKE